MEGAKTELLGQKVESVEELWAAGPGAYRITQVTPADGVESVTCVHAACPGGCGNYLMLGPKPPAAGHFLKVEDDGTPTVQLHPPEDPTNSNSTLCPCGWHGQLIRGLWSPV